MSKMLQIQCSNPHCKTPNSFEQNHNFCLQCGTAITKRYLRVIGGDLEPSQTLISDRYVIVSPQVVLETKPSELPFFPENLPNEITPYLQLFPYRLNIPQVYGQLIPPEEISEAQNNIWLLDYGSLALNENDLKQGKFFPLMVEQWQNSTMIRKLNWLRQITILWNPLIKKGVVSSLLNPNLLGVNDQILHILELQLDQGKHYTFKNLGEFLETLIPKTDTEFSEFLSELCQRLINEQIHSPKQLLAVIDYALEKSSKTQEYHYQVFTITDSGPSRDHNEDSCYPEPQKVVNFQGDEKVLALVCDGIGGHEGGEVASQIAIETLANELDKLDLTTEFSNEKIINHLQKSTFIANSKISEVNDQEHRQDRQRMGTTLVMALAYNHQVYLAHVGDSRIYLVTAKGVYQLTLDDDLASREVRLGYALYRDAVRYPSAGALVQALGMGSSNNLHPSIQNLTFDQDCLFLLCSDGLSDFDRVDQYWDKEILPLIEGEQDIASVGKNLIDIANKRNGHDNTTVALLHCQVRSKPSPDEVFTSLSWQSIDEEKIIPVVQLPTTKIEESNSVEANVQTQPFYEETDNQKSPFLIYVSIMVTLIIIAGITLFWRNIDGLIKKIIGKIPDTEIITPPNPTEIPSNIPESSLKEKELYLVNTELNLEAKVKSSVQEENQPPKTDQSSKKLIIPVNSVIQLVSKKDKDTQRAIVRVCYLPDQPKVDTQLNNLALISLEELEAKNYAKYNENTSKIPLSKIAAFCQKEFNQPDDNSENKEATDQKNQSDRKPFTDYPEQQ